MEGDRARQPGDGLGEKWRSTPKARERAPRRPASLATQPSGSDDVTRSSGMWLALLLNARAA